MFQIRVVNAFRHGMDTQQLQQATSNPNLQRVLQKQASLSKQRLSSAGSSLETAAHLAAPTMNELRSQHTTSTRIKLQETSYSHTETAV